MAIDSTALDIQDEDDDVLDESHHDDDGLFDTGDSSLKYFGADFDISGLVRRLDDEDIIIPRFDPDESQGSEIAGFQRQRVWTAPRMEKFIESLLLGWPVPGIFLVLEPDQRFLILDGQQRLTTLQFFFSGRYPNGREFKLIDVVDHLQGATYSTLTRESKRKLNNTFIQATIIEPQGDTGIESVYRLFGRLNSGGVSLTAQEIRVALFRGPVIDWIRGLNADMNWRRLFGAPHKRLKDHELILRALALEEVLASIDGDWDNPELRLSAYRPPMSDFLNRYLTRNRDMTSLDPSGLEEGFNAACDLLYKAAGSDGLKFDGRINAAHVDAVLASLMYLAQSDDLPDVAATRSALAKLRDDGKYSEYVTQSTSHRDSVFGRIRVASNTLRPS